MKLDLTEDFEKIIVSWLKSNNENVTNLAYSLNKYANRKALTIHSVVFNEASPSSKEHQEKLLREIMHNDEKLGLYSEVELCCVCEKKKSNTGYDLKFCKECWEEED
tara:strand:+ start:118 stop:438 length:321 start_codon:yes stop_codon:yes gene_type:complete